jgi:uncharacterized integral membrane protein
MRSRVARSECRYRARSVPEQKTTNWRAWILGAIATLFAIVALQNSQDVKVDILFINTTMPLIAALLASVAIGAALGYVTPLVLRHRREERRSIEGE